METMFCPICGATVYFSLSKKVKKCSVCSSLYLRQSLNRHDNKSAERSLSEPENKKLLGIFRRRLELLLTFVSMKGKFLDIGPGNGLFLKVATEKKLDIAGFDRSNQINRYLSKQGYPMYSSLNKIKNNSLDTITLFDVIEHNKHPQVLLEKIAKKLKSGGILMITTPNSKGFSGQLIKNKFWGINGGEHYVALNAKSLQTLLEQFGFKILRLETNMIHWWYFSKNPVINNVVNRFIFWLTYPIQKIIFYFKFGDNLEIIAKKANRK